jgi:hypothetical protein
MTVHIGRVSWAEWVPNPNMNLESPHNKVHPGVNAGKNGIACHSMEGWLRGAKFIPRAFAPFPPATNDLSNMFTLAVDGSLYQHYPVTSKCWCSGNLEANSTTWSVEAEGTAISPLSISQRQTMLRLFGEWESHTGLKATRGDGHEVMWWAYRLSPEDRTIWQHNEIAATACPSGRYDEVFAEWEAQDDMSHEHYEELKARIARLEGATVGLDAAGNSNQEAITRILRDNTYIEPRVTRLEAAPPSTGVENHKHRQTGETGEVLPV